MAHEAVTKMLTSKRTGLRQGISLCDALKHAAWFEDEGRKNDTTEIGSRSQLGYDMREDLSTSHRSARSRRNRLGRDRTVVAKDDAN